MEFATKGKVLVTALLENLGDVFEVEKGQRTADQVRHVEVTDALVDTGVSGLLVPSRLVQQLGVPKWRTRSVRLTISGRDCISDMGEIADEFPIIVGRIPLLSLDWVVDPACLRLIGNPEHSGEHMMDVL
jgi:hypothetical protein